MERVEFSGSFFTVPAKPPEKRDDKKTSRKSRHARLFNDLLETHTEEEKQAEAVKVRRRSLDLDKEIGKALDAVHSRGDKLKKNPTLDTIAEYKDAVRQFLQIAVSSAFEAREETSPPRREGEEERRFIQIRVINEKLEKLTAQVLSSQKNELEILRRVDEIHGLLIDLRY
ncbi:MAG: DUF327 family protein [Spirochaetaceae bacterium]|nr:DUF327 family protein [Spirochaetaceae bacterium]